MRKSKSLLLPFFILIICSLFHSNTIQAQQKYVSLKAMLIVGHQEDGTSSAISDMNKIAAVFEQHGIQVQPVEEHLLSQPTTTALKPSKKLRLPKAMILPMWELLDLAYQLCSAQNSNL